MSHPEAMDTLDIIGNLSQAQGISVYGVEHRNTTWDLRDVNKTSQVTSDSPAPGIPFYIFVTVSAFYGVIFLFGVVGEYFRGYMEV